MNDLTGQRTVIASIDDKNKQARSQLEQTNLLVNQMTRKEFQMKLILTAAIVLLFLVDVFVFFFHTLGL